MDRKTIIVLVISFVMLMLWVPFVNWLYPPKPIAQGTNALGQATNQIVLTNASPTAPSLSPTPTTPVERPAAADPAKEKTETLTANGITYTFTSLGGGLKQVELPADQYPVKVLKKSQQTNDPQGAVLNRGALLPLLALSGHPSLTEDWNYQLAKIPGGIRAEKQLSNGLHIIKEFRPSSNYLLQATVRIENRSGQPMLLPTQEYIAGTASLVHSQEDPLQLGVYVYDGKRVTHLNDGWFANRTLGCIPGTPRELFESTELPVLWTAVHNRFFTLATIPTEAAPKAMAHKVDLNLQEKMSTLKTGFQTSLVFPSAKLESASGTNFVEKHFTIYTGPKEYNELAGIGDRMKNNLDFVMEFNGFFGFFSKVLLLSMNWLHDSLKLPYGWAIIAITVIIKLLFWPLTQASTRSMKRMAALQPEMKKIQEKYKDDPQKMNRKTMEFMKEHKVSPLGGCLPMLIQIPVFFGFYYMIQSAIELRGAGFLWAWDLSVPDTIATLAGFPINPLPIVMGVTMFWQAQLTPPSPGMDPTQQKIMKYMPLIFLFVLYNMSSGLTLYWTVQNILTIVQTKLTKTNEPAPATTPAAPLRKK